VPKWEPGGQNNSWVVAATRLSGAREPSRRLGPVDQGTHREVLAATGVAGESFSPRFSSLRAMGLSGALRCEPLASGSRVANC
jgi:hypothetical protein